jgi:tetratricopeptide (TPR) repeat protein
MRFGVRAAAFLLFVPVLSFAADEPLWTKITTKNFELYTTAGEKNGRETIQRFEQVRGFFAQSMNRDRPTDKPVRIIAFRSKKEYEPYRPREGTTAYYLPGQDRDLIVIGDAKDEQAYPVVVHEYVHLLVRHSGLEPPVWLNEGIAEVYSTLQPYAGQVAVGAVPAGRYHVLRNSKWLDLGTLLSVTHDSPHYNEKDRAGVFYSQSWALYHMLYFSEEYRPKFLDFLKSLGTGVPEAHIFQEVYGKSLGQVTRDLRFYINGDRMRVVLFDVKLEKSAEQPETEPAPPLEVGVLLAEVLTSLRKGGEARKMLEELAKQHPKEPGPFEGLAYLDLRERNWEQAVVSFKRAAELGAASPRFYYDYAMTLRRSGGKPADGIPILQIAVALQPDFVEARLSLGFDLLNEGRHAEALGALAGIKRIKEEQAVSLYRALAYVQHRLGNEEGAIKALQLAAKYARTPEEKSDVESLRQGINRVKESRGAVAVRTAEAERADAGPTDSTPRLERKEQKGEEVLTATPQYNPVLPGAQSVEGVLHELHCSGKTAKLTILVEGQEKAFLIDDPAKVVVKHSGDASIDFTCGRQEPTPVLLRYVAAPADATDVLGVVRGIEVVEGKGN